MKYACPFANSNDRRNTQTSAGEFERSCLKICAQRLELNDSFQEFVARIANLNAWKLIVTTKN